MNTLEAIKTRRSIRKYQDRKIEPEKIQQILEAAMQAPSARNKQPWQFIVVDDKDVLKKLSIAHPYAKMLTGASHAILVCGDKTLEKEESYLLQNCCAATQNMLLAIHELGLGAVWLGVQPREERINAINELLNIPEHIFPVALLSLGYPDEVVEPVDRFIPVRVHWNKW
jgi:nitroreductase